MSKSPSDERTVPEEHAVLVADLEPRSTVLMATLGGVAGGIGIPRFEFMRMASDLGVKTVFVRDPTQSWYHGKLRGIGRGLNGVARTIEAIVARERVERTVVVGNSMGGFAALIVGSLIGANEVHAFSPTTFIGPVGRLRHRDQRWRRQILRAYRLSLCSPKYFDVMPVLTGCTESTRFHVHYSTEDPLDVVHAERLAGVAGVELHAYAHGGHLLVKHLRDSGLLASILRSALFEEERDPATRPGRPEDTPRLLQIPTEEAA